MMKSHCPPKEAVKKMGSPYMRIGLLDHMGFGNLGDAAILESFIQNIRERLPDVDIVAFSADPEDTSARHKIPCHPIRNNCRMKRRSGSVAANQEATSRLRTAFKKAIQHSSLLRAVIDRTNNISSELAHLIRSYQRIYSLDLLVISGGGQLCDLWHDQPYNVFKFCLLARLAHTPVYIVGVGADRLQSRRGRLFARWSVALSDYTSFRDIESRTLMQNLGCKALTHVCPDPAYALIASAAYVPTQTLPPRRIVGLNPMGFCDPRMWPRADPAEYRRYLDKLTAFAIWLLTNGYDVQLFSSDIGVDRFAIDDLERSVKDAISPEMHARVGCDTACTLDGLLTQMARLDIVVTPKFHGVVFSHMLARPVVALSYMPKIAYLMRRAGCETLCLDIDRFTTDELISAFIAAANQYERLQAQVRQLAADYRSDLTREFDRLCSMKGRSPLTANPDSVTATQQIPAKHVSDIAATR